MQITYYAGAADAAGVAGVQLEAGDLTTAELLGLLGAGDVRLAEVLSHCSILVDGSPVRGEAERIPATARVDVLPPFAGG
ncbi:MAG: MoaD/ThiS family protein [Propionicimonas sp.]